MTNKSILGIILRNAERKLNFRTPCSALIQLAGPTTWRAACSAVTPYSSCYQSERERWNGPNRSSSLRCGLSSQAHRDDCLANVSKCLRAGGVDSLLFRKTPTRGPRARARPGKAEETPSRLPRYLYPDHSKPAALVTGQGCPSPPATFVI